MTCRRCSENTSGRCSDHPSFLGCPDPPVFVGPKVEAPLEPGTILALDALNPKDAVGQSKVPIVSVIPPASIVHEAAAMRYGAHEAPRKDGGKGYGPYNWRSAQVRASIYVDAAIRHILDWWDGEDLAPDSKVHHLGHAKAGLGILLDAMETGNLVDDRPTPGKAAEILERLRRR
jgi:hypothetical protein